MIYRLIRSRRRKKTLSVQVDRHGRVLVRVPFLTPQADIDGFLNEKKQWLDRVVGRQRRSRERPARSFLPGDRFPYLGENYVLRVRDRNDSEGALTFTGHEFLLGQDDLKGARVLFQLWYRQQAQAHLEQRVRRFGGRLGLFPRGVAVSSARSRWGSCSPDDRLRFSWRLIMAPPEIVDYVVVHELCHMKFRNHSRDYWELVGQVLPDHRQRRAWLRDHGHRLTF